MALSDDWIVTCVITALQFYLAPNLESLNHISPFTYAYDNSNLFICATAEPGTTLLLLDCEIDASEKVVATTATDGTTQIKTTFLRSVLEQETAEAIREKILCGITIQVLDYEFRLANHLDSPRVSLHLRKFNLVKSPDEVGIRGLATIHDHRLANQLLDTWARRENALTMSTYSSSPEGIKSQIGDMEEKPSDSDTENNDPTSTSQAQLATQLPLQETPPKSTFNRRQSPRSKGSLRTASVNVRLFQEDDLRSRSTPKTRKQAHAPQKQSDATSSTPDLTQHQLVVPFSSEAMQRNSKSTDVEARSTRLENDVNDRNPTGSAVESEYMPAALVQLMRNWRQECHNSRYIPRRLQIIPRDQLQLLESDDRWQPPLIGHSERLGIVPTPLLSSCTREADLQSLQSGAESKVLQSRKNENHSHNQNEPHTPHEKLNSANESDTDSSESISWSPTPTRRQLPMDSSPLDSCRQQSNVIQQQACDSFGKSTELFELDVARQPSRTEKEERTKATLLGKKTPQTLGNARASAVAQSPISVDRATYVPPLTFTANPHTDLDVTQRTVQVKQTPFPAKEKFHSDSTPDSTTRIIPGTFDERSMKERPPVPILATTVSLPKSSKWKGGFEMDSSEDEVATTYQETDAAKYQEPTQIQETSETDLPGATGNMDLGRTTKRRSEADRSTSSKRIKMITQDMSRNESDTVDYKALDEDRVRYRREYLRNLSNRQSLSTPVLSTTIIPMQTVQSGGGSSHIQHGTSFSSSPPTRHYEQVGTSDTHFSVHHDDPRKFERGSADRSVYDHPDESLYAKFKDVYPNYGGLKMHFVATCQLLQQLYLRGQATHPSLWDDFVFRHFHDYRDHLRHVMENSGSALPYERFYEERVEQPTCLQRIIKPSHISMLSTFPGSTSRLSLSSDADDRRIDIQQGFKPHLRTDFDRSVATESVLSSTVPMTKSPKLKLQTLQSEVQAPDLENKSPHAPKGKETFTQNKSHSQGSRTSIKIWLEKAAGVESPILGTPQTEIREDVDIPVLDLPQTHIDAAISSSISGSQKRKRTLPWSKQDLSGRDDTRVNAADSKQLKHTLCSSDRHQKLADPTLRTADLPKMSQKITQPPPPPTGSLNHKTKKGNSHSETAFQRFTRFYENIPSEKRAMKTVVEGIGKPVNVFAWRN